MSSHNYEVIAVLADHLGVDPLAIEGRQRLEEDWGLDGLDLALLVNRLEDTLDIQISEEALDPLRTVADFEVVVRKARGLVTDDLGLGAGVTSSLREEVRRMPARTRRNWVHRQTRRTLRNHIA
ncbi:MAG: hypothetical protein JWO86_4876 [Myxococcaceae bacterium]|nr:hypothetical protein [Myxococcaceae bacterium]MEA2751775.1 hypothetical protein [Myxococcales bacterium]